MTDYRENGTGSSLRIADIKMSDQIRVKYVYYASLQDSKLFTARVK